MKSILCSTLLTLGVASADQVPVFVGTQSSEGIYRLYLDSETGKLSGAKSILPIGSPSSLALSADGSLLFSTSRSKDEKGRLKIGSVASYQVSITKDLKHINTQPAVGSGPCYIFTDGPAENLLVANYGSGCVTSYQIAPNGKISAPVSHIQHEGSSVHPKRQNKPHAHSIHLTPDRKFAYAADLGIDLVKIYQLDPKTAELKPAGSAKVPAGSGARHMAFTKDASQLFVLNELTLTISKFTRDANTGQLTLIDTKPATTQKGENLSCSEIHLSKDGKHLYAAVRDIANEGRDAICVLNPTTLTIIQDHPAEAWIPRHFNISPSGKWLLIAGQKSNSVVVHQRDPETGKLTKTENSASIPKPMWILFP